MASSPGQHSEGISVAPMVSPSLAQLSLSSVVLSATGVWWLHPAKIRMNAMADTSRAPFMLGVFSN